jgi:hypothetical protein
VEEGVFMVTAEEYIEKLKRIWTDEGSPGLPILRGLKGDAIFDLVKEPEGFTLVFRQPQPGKWVIEKGPAKESVDCTLTYRDDPAERLKDARTTEELERIYAGLVKEKKIQVVVKIPLPKLAAKGYIGFAKRVGLL